MTRRRMKKYSRRFLFINGTFYLLGFVYAVWFSYAKITEGNAGWSWAGGVVLISSLWGISQAADEITDRMEEGTL